MSWVKTASGRVIVDTDWGDERVMAPIEERLPGGGFIRGLFPRELWWENTTFPGNQVTYELATDQSERFMQVRTVLTGKPERFLQLRDKDWPLSLDKECLYRVTARFRGPPGQRWMMKLGDQEIVGVFPGGFGWVDLNHDFVLKGTSRGFMLQVHPIGDSEITLGIKHIKVEEIPIESLRRAAADAPAAKPGVNLLKHSRFPLGLTSGLTPRRSESGGLYMDYAPVADANGPSGFPAARVVRDAAASYPEATMERPKRQELFTPHFATYGDQPHVLSFYARGRGKVRLEVAREWNAAGTSGDVELDPVEWRRVWATFRPSPIPHPPHHGRIFLELPDGGEAWFDAFQLELGSKPGDYRSPTAAEVTLSTEQYRNHVQFTDEPAEVLYAATGELAGAKLRIHVSDLYGNGKNLEPVELSADGLATGQISLPEFGDLRNNILRVLAWVERDGKPASAVDELIVGRVPRPRYWGRWAPDSPFGVHSESERGFWEMAKKLGFNWRREWFGFGMRHFWPEKDQEPKVFHAFMEEAERVKTYSLPILIGIPPWALEDYPPLEPGSGDLPKKGLFGDYAGKLVAAYEKSYPGMIRAVEVWNEPFFPQVYLRKGRDPETKRFEHLARWGEVHQEVARLHREAYSAVKREAPQVEVVGISGSIETLHRDYTKDQVKDTPDILDNLDIVSYHDYQFGDGFPGGFTVKAVEEAHRGVEKNGKPVRMWMTEGIPNYHMTGQGLLRYGLPSPPPEDPFWHSTDAIIRWHAATLAAGTERIFAYSIRAHGFYSGSPTRGHSTFTNDLAQLHPTGLAFANFAWLMEDTRYIGEVELAPKVAMFVFEDKKARRTVGVIAPALKEGDVSYRPEFGPRAQLLDLFGNPMPRGSVVSNFAAYVVGETPEDIVPAGATTRWVGQ